MCVVNIKKLSDPYGQISNTPGVANALALGHGLGPGWLWVRCPRLAPGDQGRRWAKDTFRRSSAMSMGLPVPLKTLRSLQ